jgi:hypothetical protein
MNSDKKEFDPPPRKEVNKRLLLLSDIEGFCRQAGTVENGVNTLEKLDVFAKEWSDGKHTVKSIVHSWLYTQDSYTQDSSRPLCPIAFAASINNMEFLDFVFHEDWRGFTYNYSSAITYAKKNGNQKMVAYLRKGYLGKLEKHFERASNWGNWFDWMFEYRRFRLFLKHCHLTIRDIVDYFTVDGKMTPEEFTTFIIENKGLEVQIVEDFLRSSSFSAKCLPGRDVSPLTLVLKNDGNMATQGKMSRRVVNDLLRLLLERGAYPNYVLPGDTSVLKYAIQYAIERGSGWEHVDLLLENGATFSEGHSVLIFYNDYCAWMPDDHAHDTEYPKYMVKLIRLGLRQTKLSNHDGQQIIGNASRRDDRYMRKIIQMVVASGVPLGNLIWDFSSYHIKPFRDDVMKTFHWAFHWLNMIRRLRDHDPIPKGVQSIIVNYSFGNFDDYSAFVPPHGTFYRDMTGILPQLPRLRYSSDAKTIADSCPDTPGVIVPISDGYDSMTGIAVEVSQESQCDTKSMSIEQLGGCSLPDKPVSSGTTASNDTSRKRSRGNKRNAKEEVDYFPHLWKSPSKKQKK